MKQPMCLPTDTIDYSQTKYWLSTSATIDKPVDVFYLYPTSWQCMDNSVPRICAIDDPTMLAGAPLAFQRQATVFQTIGNIYAPYYRQNNFCPTDRETVTGSTPTSDAKEAFGYYIKHFNQGRPYILLGHSQGANVLNNLLADYMKANPDVYKNMIAAYVIGYSVTTDFLAQNPHLKFAEGADDTGVIISYNTQAPDVEKNPVLSAGVSLVINPLTWTREEIPASTDEGLGSFMPDISGKYVKVPQYADARIDKTRGVLICSSADEEALFRLTGAFKGLYHSFDISFYYYNLRANATQRTQKFLATK
jgi:hypothetical protein